MKVKEAIKELEISPEDTIFIRQYNKVGEDIYIVQDLDKSILNKKIKLIQGNYGGKEYGYCCYRFILV